MSSLTSSTLSAMEAQSMAQYIRSFVDLVDNLPNDITRYLTQLHDLDNNYCKLINKMNTNIQNYNHLIQTIALFNNNNILNNYNINTNINTNSNDININNNYINNNSSEVLFENKRRLAKRIESQLIQMQELSDEKLKYSQFIIDLIETKSKELDLDYEQILRLNDLTGNKDTNNNNSINSNNKMSAKSSLNSNKTNSNSSSQQSINSVSHSTEDQKNSINDENNRNNDKRLLPRRACALKPGEMNESNFEVMPKLKKQKPMTCRTTKYSSKTKPSNFSLSMSNFYRDMARRRAKLPIKMKTKKSVSLALKRNANNRKNVNNSNKNLIVANSEHKESNGNYDEFSKNYNKRNFENNPKKKLSLTSSSTSSSISSESSQESKPNNDLNDDKKVLSTKSNTSQLNGKKETKRLNSNSSINNNKKKSKTQIDNSIDDLFIGEPIDPNEPIYCLCSQVSYGEMICCDNELCRIEWFHFPCVDLVYKPKGKWFCPLCRGERSNLPKK